MSDQQQSTTSNNVPIQTTDASFENEVLNSEIPVLVDFWAEWCGPCKMIAPILDEIAAEYAGKIKVAKVDIEANPQLPSKFAVRSIPTLILFNNGKVESQSVGAVSKTKLVSLVESLL